MADVSKYFFQDPKTNTVRFLGDKLECFIPTRYEMKELLIVGSKISALGIFTMKINDSITCGLQIPAVVIMDPVATRTETIDGDSFFICEFHKNNTFLTTTTVMKDNKLPYLMYLEYLSLGNMPSYITYDNVVGIFDDIDRICGLDLPVDHSIMEIIYAHVYRDAKDLRKYYRHTPMTQPPAQITLRDVAHGASSTHSRLVGSFADDGRNAALLNHSDQNHELEDFWRM